MYFWRDKVLCESLCMNGLALHKCSFFTVMAGTVGIITSICDVKMMRGLVIEDFGGR